MAETDLTKLGKYDIVRILGRGAMGTVYEGFDPIIARRVAIKTVGLEHADDPEAAEDLQRFKREAQAAGRLTHPNIVGVYDYGETESIAYIVMEYVEGDSLKSMLDNGERFTADDAVKLMEALLAGLAYSHEHGVIHRDIKPANVMITKDGRVKLADFGVARIESSSLTQAGTMIGTPSYMSPEQFMGQTIDARTDIYSAGVMFYQLLTGEKPFEGSITAIMHKVLNVEPPAPSVLSISVTPRLDEIVRRAMAKRPDDRFATAREFADALTESGEAGLSGAPSGPPEAGFDEDATMVAGAMPTPATPSAPAASAPKPAPRTAAAPPTARNYGMLLGGIAVVAIVIAGGGTYFLLGGGGRKTPAPPSTTAPKPTIAATKKPAPAPTAPNPPPSNAAAPASPAPSQTATTPPSPPPQATPGQPAAPTQPPAPAPSTTQPVAPAQPSPPSPAAIQAKLDSAIGAVSCALTRGYGANGQYRIDGIVSSADRASLTAAIGNVKSSLPGVAVTNDLRDFTGPYCGVISAIRGYASPFAPATSQLGMQMAGGKSDLVEGDKITVNLTPPAWATNVEIDYVSSNGQIYRIQPKIGSSAGGMLQETLGSVGAPFGRDMIVAIATSAPLPLKKGGELTGTKTWPATLKADLSRIKADGGHVATAAVLLDTTRKQ